ncbi:hypothetical protein ACRE_022490 [Hapsidospora chrysogenum ATCC 11550]|uniref:Uncharacterized protein n=1 Tax=Hapsidospora chrysogenum (strain ATCC 11550 / CBS 779.69 / DSM 880 / IAM 14645 / JCM 23072 / IMI 49137) TaxID=857340 RepID=A0A086TC24_HAPC1|nr:hypothetical protein ACRE_022490 [Hapsidospora chrysogenum ATCC 11550]
MAGTNETQPQETFKQQLDRAAEDGRTGADSQHSSRPIVDKITEYVPGASKVLGGGWPIPSETDTSHNKSGEVPGPPERPDHDPKIEEFVRDQHRSKADDGGGVTLNS